MTDRIYEGKAKILYSTDDPNVLSVFFKDDATAFNRAKQGTISRKGELNCTIATHLLQYLSKKGIPNHFLQQTAPDRMEVKAVNIILIEVVVRNISAGSLSKRLGLELGQVLPHPIVEYYYKNDHLGDPLITTDHIQLLKLATSEQVNQLRELALAINIHLQQFFNQCHLTLVDFKLEFGVDCDGEVILADEISPDTCRLWDQDTENPTDRILDKDRFRQNLGNESAAYQEVLRRIVELT